MSVRDRVVVAILAAFSLVNVATFVATDAHAAPQWRALYSFDGPDFMVVGNEPGNRDEARLSQPIAIGSLAPGSTVVFAGGDRNDWGRYAQRFAGLGRAAHVAWLDGPPVFAGDVVDIESGLVASGPGSPKGLPWLVVVDPARLAGATVGDPETYVQRAQAGEDVWVAGEPIDFVVVLVEQPRGNYDRQIALVEASLLAGLHDERLEPWS